MKELAKISFYHTLANYENQRQVLAAVEQEIINGGLARENFEEIKHYIVPSGFDVEKLIEFNLEHGLVRWIVTKEGERLVSTRKQEGDGVDWK